MMDLGFGHLVAVVARMHPAVEARIVQSRLKYFQRLPFPSAAIRVGTGGRAEYPPADLLKLVTAFELLAAGIGPQMAANLVTDTWEGLGLRVAETWAMRGKRARESLIMVRADGLKADSDASGILNVGHLPDIQMWVRSSDIGDRRVTVVDAARMLAALAAAAAKELPTPVAKKLESDIDDWANQRMEVAEELTGT